MAVSGNTLLDGRPREHNSRTLESISSLSCQLSKMRTRPSEWSAAEFWLIPMECGWVKSKNKEQGIEKDKSKGKGNKNPKSGELTKLRSNCRNWVHNVPSCWHGKEKQVNRVRNKAATVSVSSSSSTLMATDVDTRELRLIESGRGNAKKELAGYGRWFCSDQSVLHGLCDFRARVRIVLPPTRLCLSKTGEYEGWYNEMDLRSEVFTKVLAVVCEEEQSVMAARNLEVMA